MSESGIAEIHPFDVTKLEKGDWISPDRCESVVGMRRTDKNYALRLLAIAQELERQWQQIRVEQITICSEKDGLRICTDDEAVNVNKDRRLSAVRAMERAQVRQCGVDAAKLSTTKIRGLHEREVVVGAAFLVGGRKHAQAELQAHQRSTPRMLPGDKK